MENLKTMKLGLLLSLLSIFYGFSLGIVFGAFEDNVKGHLKSEAESVLDTVYKGDQAKMDKIVSKSWVYFKRAHLHANGIGTTALAMIILLSIIPMGSGIRKFTAFSLGFGALFYSMYWMFAGLTAPAIGSTHDAKEALDWLAIPSAGLAVIGVVITLILVIRHFFQSDQ